MATADECIDLLKDQFCKSYTTTSKSILGLTSQTQLPALKQKMEIVAILKAFSVDIREVSVGVFTSVGQALQTYELRALSNQLSLKSE